MFYRLIFYKSFKLFVFFYALFVIFCVLINNFVYSSKSSPKNFGRKQVKNVSKGHWSSIFM